MLAIRIILHPTDFSEQSDHAFRLACSLARDHGARLIVLHVRERLGPMAPPRLAPKSDRLSGTSCSTSSRRIPPSPSSTCCRRATRPGPSCVSPASVDVSSWCWGVTAGREWTGCSWAAWAEKIVRGAPWPVLTVKNAPHLVPPAEGLVTTGAGQDWRAK